MGRTDDQGAMNIVTSKVVGRTDIDTTISNIFIKELFDKRHIERTASHATHDDSVDGMLEVRKGDSELMRELFGETQDVIEVFLVDHDVR